MSIISNKQSSSTTISESQPMQFISNRYKNLFTKITKAQDKAYSAAISGKSSSKPNSPRGKNLSKGRTVTPVLPDANNNGNPGITVPLNLTNINNNTVNVNSNTSTHGEKEQHGPGRSESLPTVVKPANGPLDVTKSQEKPRTGTNAPLNELKPISESTAYNITRIDAPTWKSMHQTLKAKYLMYTIPEQYIEDHMKSCHVRSLVVLKKHREMEKIKAEQMETILLRKRDKYIDIKEQEQAQMGIARARKRRELKMETDKQIRDAEVQALIEGQKSSIDAIRLKELLTGASISVHNDLKLTEKDKFRIKTLMDFS